MYHCGASFIAHDTARLSAFFAPAGYVEAVFANEQLLDWDGLCARANSSSYVPAPGDPRHAAFVDGLREIFERHQENGRVVFAYHTRLFFGGMSA